MRTSKICSRAYCNGENDNKQLEIFDSTNQGNRAKIEWRLAANLVACNQDFSAIALRYYL